MWLGSGNPPCLPLALLVISSASSAWGLLDYAASWYSCWPFWSVKARHFTQQYMELWLSSPLCAGTDQATEWANLFSWGPESGRTVFNCSLLRLYYWLGSTNEQAVGFKYYLGAVVRNSVYQDLSAGYCKPLSLLHYNHIPNFQTLQILLQSLLGKPELECPKRKSNVEGAGCPPWAFFPQGDLSGCCCTSLGKNLDPKFGAPSFKTSTEGQNN